MQLKDGEYLKRNILAIYEVYKLAKLRNVQVKEIDFDKM